MTAFEFMIAAFCSLAGVVCFALAVIIVCGVVFGIRNALKGGGKDGQKRK